jgi:hypothetical protein
MGDPLDFVDEGGWPYPDEDPDTREPEPVDLRSDADDDLVALHALSPRALAPLSDDERAVVAARFGPALGMSRARCRAALASGLIKLRDVLGDDQV